MLTRLTLRVTIAITFALLTTNPFGCAIPRPLRFAKVFFAIIFQIKTAQVICAANLLFYIVKRKRRNVKTSVVKNVDERAAALRVAIHDALVGVVVYAHAVCQSYALICD